MIFEKIYDEAADLIRFSLWLMIATDEPDYRKWRHKMRLKDFFSMDLLTVYVLILALICYCL